LASLSNWYGRDARYSASSLAAIVGSVRYAASAGSSVEIWMADTSHIHSFGVSGAFGWGFAFLDVFGAIVELEVGFGMKGFEQYQPRLARTIAKFPDNIKQRLREVAARRVVYYYY
jgi:hypothetical protein